MQKRCTPATLKYDWSNSISAVHNVPLQEKIYFDFIDTCMFFAACILNMQQGTRLIISWNGEEEIRTCMCRRMNEADY